MSIYQHVQISQQLQYAYTGNGIKIENEFKISNVENTCARKHIKFPILKLLSSKNLISS